MKINIPVFVKRLSLLIPAGICFVVVIWIGGRLFRPVNVPFLAPSKGLVHFDSTSADVRKNPLFDTLVVHVSGTPSIENIGNDFPFIGSNIQKDGDVDLLLRVADLAEVPLSGKTVRDIVRVKDGSLMALLFETLDSGDFRYTLTLYTGLEEVVFASWTIAPTFAQKPVSMAQDEDGLVWLLSETGAIGTVVKGKTPVWRSDLRTSLSGSDRLRIVVDDVSRIWVTDGSNVSVGGDREFVPINLFAELREDDRVKLLSSLQALPESIRPTPKEGPDGLVRAALQPEGIYPLNDGRLAITTGYGVFTFPLSTLTKPDWKTLLDSQSLTLAVARSGELLGVNFPDRSLVRRSTSGTIDVFKPSISPLQIRTNPSLLTSLGSRMYALDYSTTTAPYFWSILKGGEGWSVKIVRVAGSLPLADSLKKVEVDSQGSLWAITSGGSLLRISEGSTSTSSEKKQ